MFSGRVENQLVNRSVFGDAHSRFDAESQ